MAKTACDKCGELLTCECDSEVKVGQVNSSCSPKQPAALWVHVTDDTGKDIAEFPIRKTKSEKPVTTDKRGLVKFDPLTPGDYEVALPEGEHPLSKTHDLPKVLSKPVKVKDGKIASVAFQLRRKAKLTIKLVLKPGPSKSSEGEQLFKELGVKVTITGRTSEPPSRDIDADAGIANFEFVSAGFYKLTVKFVDDKQNRFDFAESPEREIELLPGEDEPLVFLVEPLYTKVRFIAHCLASVAKQIWTGGKLPTGYWDETPEKRGHINKELDMNKWKAEYTGKKATEVEDVGARVSLLESVLGQAARGIESGDDDQTLKVFMVPECFFLGKYGAYPVEVVSNLIEKLQKLVQGDNWRHWVFAFGTVNAVYSDDDGKVREMNNMTPVLRGGCPSIEKSHEYTRVILKAVFCQELPTSADFQSFDKNAVTEDVVHAGFGANEKEVMLGRLIMELLDDAKESKIGSKAIGKVFEEGGLVSGDWTALRKLVKDKVDNVGLTAMLRMVRPFNEYSKPATEPLCQDAFFFDAAAHTVKPDFRDKRWNDIAMRLLAHSLNESGKTLDDWKEDESKTNKAEELAKLVVLCTGVPGVVEGIAIVSGTLQEKIHLVIEELKAGVETKLYDELCQGVHGADMPDWRDAAIQLLVAYLKKPSSEIFLLWKDLSPEAKMKELAGILGDCEKVQEKLPGMRVPPEALKSRVEGVIAELKELQQMKTERYEELCRGIPGSTETWYGAAIRLLADSLINLKVGTSSTGVIEIWKKYELTEQKKALENILSACENVQNLLVGTEVTGKTVKENVANVIKALDEKIGEIEKPNAGHARLYTQLFKEVPGNAEEPCGAAMRILADSLIKAGTLPKTYVGTKSAAVIKFWKSKTPQEKVEALQIILPDCENVQKLLVGTSIEGSTLKGMVQGVIDELAKGMEPKLYKELRNEGRESVSQGTWRVEWAPLFRKLLQMYLLGRPSGVITDPALFKKPEYMFEDFSFRCGRKPGPWLESSEKAKHGYANIDNLPPGRKLIFGLEICADHSSGRLRGSIGSSAVDIQLVPSAGMVIQPPEVVANEKGYVFNCDGWNASKAMKPALDNRGGKIQEIVNKDWPDDSGHNPLLPHSELLKKKTAGEAKKDEDYEWITESLAKLTVTKLTDDVKDIFAYGPGELHIYSPQELPDVVPPLGKK